MDCGGDGLALRDNPGGYLLSDKPDQRFQELRDGESSPSRKQHQFANRTVGARGGDGAFRVGKVHASQSNLRT